MTDVQVTFSIYGTITVDTTNTSDYEDLENYLEKPVENSSDKEIAIAMVRWQFEEDEGILIEEADSLSVDIDSVRAK